MPELPEVQTTVNGINKTVKGLKIVDVWTDYSGSSPHFAKAWTGHGKMHAQSIRSPLYFKKFKKKVVGSKIKGARRRAKNILIDLSNNETILIHMKMTGHIMYGEYKFDRRVPPNGGWRAIKLGPLQDPYNQFIHFVLIFENGKQLVFSDVRKFAKVSLIETKNHDESIHLAHLGPEPLDKNFTYEKFKERLLKRPNGKIKSVLMDQTLISGIGNIYSDEMLWLSNVHPLSVVSKIPEANLKLMYNAMKEVLLKGIDFGGDSTSDYRNIKGERGTFQATHNAYQMNKKKCKKRGCTGTLERIIVGGRSAHFCPVHQRVYK